MRRTLEDVNESRVPRSNLPTALTSFVGRQREVAEISHLVQSSRLVTMTGAAGSGKTRVALRSASVLVQHFPDGTYWVELAQLDDPRLVPGTVANALHVPESADRPVLESLVDALDQKSLLLILDNCEHVRDACSSMLAILQSRTSVSVLATSREPLNVAGEQLYLLPPMSVPPAGAALDQLAQHDAVRLFAERARRVLPSFRIEDNTADVVASICRRLDGLPLAIELASARINVLSLEQIAERLDNRFGLLGVASPEMRTHHRTLRSAIDWSYELLSPAEQAMLRRLSVFAGGCTLDSVEHVCVGDPLRSEIVIDSLASLIDKSLVIARTLVRGDARYMFLETIREYGLEQLHAAGEVSEVRDRHLRYYRDLSEDVAPKLAGSYQQLWVAWIESEHDNLRSALSWALESEQIESGLRVAIALYQFWTIRNFATEGLRWFDELLNRSSETVSPRLRANALAFAAFMAGFKGETHAQITYGRRAAELFASMDAKDPRARAWALTAQAHGARAAGDFRAEFEIASEVTQIYRDLGESYLTGIVLTTYTPIATLLGEYERAHEMLDEGMSLLRERGDPYRIGMAWNFAGDLARCEERYARAVAAYEESLSLLRKCKAERDLASVLNNLGHATLHRGELRNAHKHFRDSMTLHQSQQNRPGMGECLIGFAALAVVTGLTGIGVRLLSAADTRSTSGYASAWSATRKEYDHYLDLARRSLTRHEFEAERAAGQSMSIQQAVEVALNLPVRTRTGRVDRRHSDELTTREREIANLVAQGKSNQEIAGELSVSKRTVEKHISNMLPKLRVTNRAGIVRRIVESGLVDPSS
jgi:predicted ATPase/DNA-binding CsgD family transcriptional regulator